MKGSRFQLHAFTPNGVERYPLLLNSSSRLSDGYDFKLSFPVTVNLSPTNKAEIRSLASDVQTALQLDKSAGSAVDVELRVGNS